MIGMIINGVIALANIGMAFYSWATLDDPDARRLAMVMINCTMALLIFIVPIYLKSQE